MFSSLRGLLGLLLLLVVTATRAWLVVTWLVVAWLVVVIILVVIILVVVILVVVVLSNCPR